MEPTTTTAATLNYTRVKLAEYLEQWVREAKTRDMNSEASLRQLLATVFSAGITTGIEIAQKIQRGEM